MQLHVEAAGVTHGFSLSVASPQCGGAGVAVSAAKAGPARRGLLQMKRRKKGHLNEKSETCVG